jgi:transcriptional regulator with XRE-family HTH domain
MREGAGISQARLAHAIGQDAPYISTLEKGKRTNIMADTLDDLAKELGCSTDYLLGVTDNPKPQPPPSAPPDVEVRVGREYFNRRLTQEMKMRLDFLASLQAQYEDEAYLEMLRQDQFPGESIEDVRRHLLGAIEHSKRFLVGNS